MFILSMWRSFSGITKTRIVYALLVSWLGFFAWWLAWPLAWGSLPILLCFAYVAGRLLFEVTVNQSVIPTLASCLVVRRRMAEILENEAKGREPFIVMDLGAGRGLLTRSIAKRIRNAQVIGVEFAWFPYWQARCVQQLFGPKNLSYVRGDMWAADCSQVDAVVLYLGPVSTERMGQKLARELKEGAVVLANGYPLSGIWTQAQEVPLSSPFKETIFVYRKTSS